MATFAKRKVRLEVEHNRDNPGNFSWRVVVWGYVSDDSEGGGEKEVIVAGETNQITRAAFRALNGNQIVNNASAAANDALQTLGEGAGDHVINADLGD